jgi:16S rRNA (adenine(1408)-N(1))-methyltransferase
VRVVTGKDVVPMGADELDALLAPYERVVADVGTGDGVHAYAHAKADPATFVIGIDTAARNLAATARRAVRKPARGGLPNLLLVQAAAEDPPPELTGLAAEVFVVLPWGKLLDGLVLGQADVLSGLAALAAPGAVLRVTLNCEVWGDPAVPGDVAHLPELTPELALATLPGPFAAAGLTLTTARMLGLDEVRGLRSTWSRRLAASREHPRFLYLEASARGVTGA